MATESPAQISLRRIPFAEMPSFSPLFEQYCTNYERVSRFYAGDFRSPEVRRAAARRAAAHERDRETLAGVLLEQNERWGLDEQTRSHIEALRDPESAAVVTGQQVGLFSGPLYTPYKTITALQLARRMSEETDRPVVPVFWLEGEDHDFEEVAHVLLLRENEPHRITYPGGAPPEADGRGPVGRIALTDTIEEVLRQADEALRPSDFKETLLAHLRTAYTPGTTLLDAFARLMRSFFPEAGLVFVNPDDARLKGLAAPLFRREVEDYAGVARRLDSVSEQVGRDFHVQVQTRPTNLFLLEESGRYAIDAEQVDGVDRFALRGKTKMFPREALLTLLERQPERFSPNVVLRPILQDTLLPTAAYVAGPGEVSYFAQFKPIYEWAGVPMPVVYPRASVTLVEGKVQKVLDRYGLSVPEVQGPLDELFGAWVRRESEVDLDALFQEAMRPLHQAVNALKPEVERVDRTLVKSVEATRAALIKELESLKGRVAKAEKRNQDEVRAQLQKAQVNLFPAGELQERALSPLYFLNKYSLSLFSDLQGALSLDTTAHQVVEV